MGSNPINLGIRFLLEVVALVASGMWGWRQSDGWPRFVLAIVIPASLAFIWTTFAVPDDPSRSGAAPVVVPGILRLIIELAIFGFATWAFYDMGMNKIGLVFGIVVMLHYAISYDRVIWLFFR